MSALDIIATVEPKTDIDPDERTGLYPVMSKLVRDEGEKLRREKVTPWAFFHSDKLMHVVDFYGKEITCSGSGVTFEGSPRTVFWGRYIEPFLEDIVLRMLDRTVALCKDEGHEAKPALMETGVLLKRLIRETYDAMADIDQRLRGQGYPDRVSRRNVSGEVDAMERFTDARLTGLIAVAKPGRTRLQRWQDYIADYRVGAAVLFVVALVAGAAAFTENVSKLAARAKTWFSPASEAVVVMVNVKNAGPESIEIEPLCEFYLTEDTGPAARQEYPKGRARLHPTGASTFRGDYGLRGWESREYRLEVPDIALYRELLRRGAANLHCVVRLSGTRQFGIGSIPFHNDLLRSQAILIEVNQVP